MKRSTDFHLQTHKTRQKQKQKLKQKQNKTKNKTKQNKIKQNKTKHTHTKKTGGITILRFRVSLYHLSINIDTVRTSNNLYQGPYEH